MDQHRACHRFTVRWIWGFLSALPVMLVAFAFMVADTTGMKKLLLASAVT